MEGFLGGVTQPLAAILEVLGSLVVEKSSCYFKCTTLLFKG